MRTLRSNMTSTAVTVAVLGSILSLGVFSSLVSAAPGDPVTTEAATSVSSSNAQLNATNGFDPATATAFWVSTSTFTPVGGPSPVLPPDVYSTGGLPGVASSTAFSANLASTTIPSALAIVPGTTYYYTAWVQSGGTWTPGAVLSVTTMSAPTITSVAPPSGSTAGGTAITITGSGFASGATVTVGGAPATGVTVVSSTTITATTPAGTAGAKNVVVTNTDGGTATGTGSFTYTAPVVLAPVISNIQVYGLGASGATISWTTNTAATSQVAYGTTTGYGSTSALNTTATTSHSIALTGLSEGTTYHFAVMSGNSAGTTTSADQTLTTSTTGSTTPLAVTSIETLDSSATADGTFENGWQYRINFTVPDNENAFRMQFTNWAMVGASSTTFATANNMRIYSAQSSNASTTGSALTLSGANTYSGWMYLSGDSNTALPGRQVSVIVDVRIPLGTTPGTYSTSFVANTTPSTATSTTP